MITIAPYVKDLEYSGDKNETVRSITIKKNKNDIL